MPYILPMKPPVAVQCKHCQGTFFMAPAQAARRTYCSRDCYRAAMQVQFAAGQRVLPGPRTAEGRQRSNANLVPRGGDAQRNALAQFWEQRGYHWQACAQCGNEFPTRATSPVYFCSSYCRLRAYQQHERYYEMRCCTICGAEFRTRRYGRAQTCSPSCARYLAGLRSGVRCQTPSSPQRPVRPPTPSLGDLLALSAACRAH